jgi:Domain of unknown function (DUF4185)
MISMRSGIRKFDLALLLALLAFPSNLIAQSATLWPEADKIFHSDPEWLGADAAFSIDLGNHRVLWMFGDSFVASTPKAARSQSTFVHNSVAIETGNDPAHAAIHFYEGRRGGHITDYASSSAPGTWLWPLHGIRLGERLLLFFMRMISDSREHSLGFQTVGWNAFMVDNPNSAPSNWQLQALRGPDLQGDVLVGMSVIHQGDYVYAFDLEDAAHDAYLVRWRARDAAAGLLSEAQWWCGVARGWQSDPRSRQVVIPNAGPEFSVQPDPAGPGYIEVNSAGFGATTIVFRRAANLEGPWDEPQALFRPPESDIPGLLVYAAKSHPELTGADLVITYVANGPLDHLPTPDMSIYFPKFIKVSLH